MSRQILASSILEPKIHDDALGIAILVQDKLGDYRFSALRERIKFTREAFDFTFSNAHVPRGVSVGLFNCPPLSRMRMEVSSDPIHSFLPSGRMGGLNEVGNLLVVFLEFDECHAQCP